MLPLFFPLTTIIKPYDCFVCRRTTNNTAITRSFIVTNFLGCCWMEAAFYTAVCFALFFFPSFFQLHNDYSPIGAPQVLVSHKCLKINKEDVNFISKHVSGIFVPVRFKCWLVCSLTNRLYRQHGSVPLRHPLVRRPLKIQSSAKRKVLRWVFQ